MQKYIEFLVWTDDSQKKKKKYSPFCNNYNYKGATVVLVDESDPYQKMMRNSTVVGYIIQYILLSMNNTNNAYRHNMGYERKFIIKLIINPHFFIT